VLGAAAVIENVVVGHKDWGSIASRRMAALGKRNAETALSG
jgi:hypothetical protein